MLLEKVNYNQISRGATVPIVLLEEFLPPGSRVLNIGCGPGEKALDQARRGYGVVGVDLNSAAIRQAVINAGGSDIQAEFRVADVTMPGFGDACDRPFAGVVAEGLFCNLIGRDPELALGNLNRILAPGDLVFVADCLRADSQGAQTVYEQHFADVPRDVLLKVYMQWRSGWLWRYEQNVLLGQRIGDERLTDGTFIVLPPQVTLGQLRAALTAEQAAWMEALSDDFSIKTLEYGDASSLQQSIEVGWVERLARHWGESEFADLFFRYGFSLIRWDSHEWHSRTGEILPGFVGVFRRS